MEPDEQLWTTQIDNVLKNNPHTRPSHTGVFACDQLPKHIERRNDAWSLVVNTHPSYKKGEHWILIYRDPILDKTVFHDSYGLKMERYDNPWFEKFFEPLDNVLTNPNQLQQTHSYACGYHAVFAACFYSLTKKNCLSHLDMCDLSPRTRTKNDEIVISFASTCADYKDAIPDKDLEQCNLRMCDCKYCD